MENIEHFLIVAGKLLMAGACGAAAGWERELKEKGAGLRTHILICVGACLFALVAVRMHEQYPGGDILRLIQGMLLGVGFIAGGVIFTQRGSVRGLTTAAGLWVLTGVGMAVGLGYYFLAIFGTVLTTAVVAWMKQIEGIIHHPPGPDQTPGKPPEPQG